jgi:U3 small nucleolar RNA-associated protein 12
MKRNQQKQEKQQQQHQQQHDSDDDEDELADSQSNRLSEITISDEIELLTSLKVSSKIRSFIFNPIPFTTNEDLALLSLINNSLEIYKIPHSTENGQLPMKLSLIDLPGHRSDLRGITVSADGNGSIATCSSESLKLWSNRTYQCTSSCYPSSSAAADGEGGEKAGSKNRYCLSLCFIQGGRYIIVGCKDGSLQV